MKISDVKGKMRVKLAPAVVRHWDVIPSCRKWRRRGTLTSGRILTQKKAGREEGLFVRVKWDGMPSPENWHLTDLTPSRY